MRQRKAQAALEFIMTYGWAMLVVLIMIGALAYMGIANPKKLLPESCTFSTGVSCKDFLLSHSGTDDLRVQFTIENNMGKAITVGPVNVTSRNTNNDMIACAGTGTVLSSGETLAYDCTIVAGAASPGRNQPHKVAIALSYINVGGSYYHRADGEIQGIVT